MDPEPPPLTWFWSVPVFAASLHCFSDTLRRVLFLGTRTGSDLAHVPACEWDPPCGFSVRSPRLFPGSQAGILRGSDPPNVADSGLARRTGDARCPWSRFLRRGAAGPAPVLWAGARQDGDRSAATSFPDTSERLQPEVKCRRMSENAARPRRASRSPQATRWTLGPRTWVPGLRELRRGRQGMGTPWLSNANGADGCRPARRVPGNVS